MQITTRTATVRNRGGGPRCLWCGLPRNQTVRWLDGLRFVEQWSTLLTLSLHSRTRSHSGSFRSLTATELTNHFNSVDFNPPARPLPLPPRVLAALAHSQHSSTRSHFGSFRSLSALSHTLAFWQLSLTLSTLAHSHILAAFALS